MLDRLIRTTLSGATLLSVSALLVAPVASQGSSQSGAVQGRFRTVTPRANIPYCNTTGSPVNCAGKPFKPIPLFSLDGQIAVATSMALGIPGDEYVLSVIDLQYQCTAQLGWQSNVPQAWEPLMYHNSGGGTSAWSRANLGSIFGLTLNPDGDIYVTATACYDTDFFPTVHGPGTGGEVYFIESTSSTISLFAALPNTGAGLGNITWDCKNDQVFISNMEDGLIYRIPDHGQFWGIPFDHGVDGRTNYGSLTEIADDGTPGFTQLGRRIWGLKVLYTQDDQDPGPNYRLYYGVWNEDNSARSATESNEVWSVQLDPVTGHFVPHTATLEISVPAMLGSPPYSNPVSDLSFKPNGNIMVAERSIGSGGPSDSGAHQSRLLEYRCGISGWEREMINGADKNGINATTGQPSCAGGVDVDYGPYPDVCDARTWTSGDALHFPGPYVYGLAGIPSAGGKTDDFSTPCIFIDLNADYSYGNKWVLGDVEIPSP